MPIGHLVLAFPGGSLEPRRDRMLVGLGYVSVTVLQVLPYLFSRVCGGCQEHLVLIAEHDPLGNALWWLQVLVGCGLVLTMAVSLVGRWRRSSRVERRALGPLLWIGSLTILLMLAHAAVALIVPRAAPVAAWLAPAAFVVVPVGFLAGLLRSRLYRESALRGLMERLRALPDPQSLRRALADALGDPALEVVYWDRDRGAYIDGDGRPVAVPTEPAKRAATLIEGAEGPVAAIVPDGGLRSEHGLVRTLGSAASLWFENERLRAELRAHVAELRSSRARVVVAADSERRRIERDLHDGAQHGLASLLLNLRIGRRVGQAPDALLDSAEAGVEAALRELRALAAGILPPVLADRGLGPAVHELVGSCPLPVDVHDVPSQRLPGPVETAAYFVVTEALANAVKHARANRLELRLSRASGFLCVEVRDDGVGGADCSTGSGLRGLAERVGALDGRFACHSVPGTGTTLRAEIPCVS